MLHRHPEHLKDFDYLGYYRYFLTFSTYRRQLLFASAPVVDLTLSQIRRAGSLLDFAILAYCFMPDHVHLLVAGTSEAADLKRFVKISKQRAAFVLSTRCGISDLWQEGFHDRVLRDGQETQDVVRYIFNNPVRAGLVRSPSEYAFMGSVLGPLEELLM